MPKLTGIRNGLVVFADILGYSKIKADNRAAAEDVFGAMNMVFTEKPLLMASFDLREWLPEEEAKEVCFTEEEESRIQKAQSIINERISINMISDSFVCLADLTDAEEEEKKLLVSALMKIVASINGYLLIRGLPLRGGIAYGEFYVNTPPLGKQPTAFLGDAIIRAHDIECDLEAACICVDPRNAEFVTTYYDVKAVSPFVDDYDEPELMNAKVYSKKYGEVDRLCINLSRRQKESLEDDLDDRIADLFSQYGKDVNSGSTPAKINNTVRFIRSISRPANR